MGMGTDLFKPHGQRSVSIEFRSIVKRREAGGRCTGVAGRSAVHPIWFQNEYRSLLKIIEKPNERWKKAAKIFSSEIDKFRDK